jgi:ketosteroid isomerase-like protein
VVEMRGPRELALEWRDALEARDADRFGRLFASDAVMVDVEHRTPDGRQARPLRGREEIERVTRAWCISTGDFDYVVNDVIEDGDRGAARWTYEWEVGARRREVEGLTWLDCRDGHIVRATVCFDTLALVEGWPETRDDESDH